MTFEELKAEAARQGYNLIKKHRYISLLKCPDCGQKPCQWHDAVSGMIGFSCYCKKKDIHWRKSERYARIAWNESVSTEEQEDNNDKG